MYPHNRPSRRITAAGLWIFGFALLSMHLSCDRRTEQLGPDGVCTSTKSQICTPQDGSTITQDCVNACASVCGDDEVCLAPCESACKEGAFKHGPTACVSECGTACSGAATCLTDCFGRCAGAEPEDRIAPHTSLDSAPLETSADRTATFAFSCNEDDCVFACSLNGGPWLECRSPKTYTGLSDGTQSFAVRAIDAAGNYDPDPASFSWKVDTFVPVQPPPAPTPLWPVHETWQDKCYHASDEIACPAAGAPYHGQDAQYSGPASDFTVNADGTVSDGVTGLMWQREDDGNSYTWQLAANYCAALSLGGYADWRMPGAHELFDLIHFGRVSPAIPVGIFPNTKSALYWAGETSAGSGFAWAVLFSYGYVYSNKKDDPTPYVRCVRG